MAIITISRELAALGDETAKKLADLLQYRYIDKKCLEDRMISLGAVERKLIKYDERKPSFWASLSQDRDDYLHFLKTALYTEAGGEDGGTVGNCILVGRGCAALLKGMPGVFSVFLSAPMEVRLERAKANYHNDERRARHILEQSDRDRSGFSQYFFELKWKDPDNYHLCLNTGFLDTDFCAALIKNALEKTVSKQAEEQGVQKLKDMVLGQRVIHHIMFDKELAIHFLEAAVESGSLTLYGVVHSQAQVEAAVECAKEVPGVKAVKAEIQVVKEYNNAI